MNSAIKDRVISEVRNAMSRLSSGQRDTESGSSPNNQEEREGSNALKTKITKKDSRSAFDLRDTEDLSPYKMVPHVVFFFISQTLKKIIPTSIE